MKNVKTISYGFTVFTLVLCAAFVALKLDGFIDWSWWLVLSPVLGTLALCVLLVVVLQIAIYYAYKNEK